MRRISLLIWAAPLGVATGFGAWLLAGGVAANGANLDDVEKQLQRMRPPAAGQPNTYANAADLITTPLFALTTGPGAVREPSLRVDGISRSRQRNAALVSIDGKPAAWMTAGETLDGITLRSVTASSATFETILGEKTLNIGDQSAASGPSAQVAEAQSGAQAASPDQAQLSGFRTPPEPASAPVKP